MDELKQTNLPANVPAKSEKGAIRSIVPKTFDDQLKFFTEITKSANTGVKTAGEAMMVFQKAKELGIGWANAVPHMPVINGKPGIDIHIIKAILSKPKSGVRWDHTENFVPVYRYIGEDGVAYEESELPPNHIVVSKFDVAVPGDKFKVAIVPTNVSTDPKKPIYKSVPVDRRSTYTFYRKKKDIDDSWIEVRVTSSFTYSEALTAGLPYDRSGKINPDSAWGKYAKLMLNTRAFTFGAREIADDLLMGNYEITELLDFSGVSYEITPEGDEVGKITILDQKGNEIKKEEPPKESPK